MHEHYTAVVREFFKPMGHSVYTLRLFDGENFLFSGRQYGDGFSTYINMARKLLEDAGCDRAYCATIVVDSVKVERMKHLHQDDKY